MHSHSLIYIYISNGNNIYNHIVPAFLHLYLKIVLWLHHTCVSAMTRWHHYRHAWWHCLMVSLHVLAWWHHHISGMAAIFIVNVINRGDHPVEAIFTMCFFDLFGFIWCTLRFSILISSSLIEPNMLSLFLHLIISFIWGTHMIQ